jgi:hypothetical protein
MSSRHSSLASRGKSWLAASVKDPLSDNTWVLWHSDWNPPATGEYNITVRATDKAGALQIAQLRDPYPNGSTGYHVVNIRITSPQNTP